MAPDLHPIEHVAHTAKLVKLHGGQVGHVTWLYTYLTLLRLEHRRHRISSGSPRCPHSGLGSLGLSVQAITTIPIKVFVRDFDEGLGTG